jgi:methyltransferase (TIGR00027 family)
MQQDRPSTTAWAVALRRAAHQLIDDPLVLDDALALQIVGRPAVQDSIARENTQGDLYQKFSRSLRAAVVARSRLAEDLLAAAVAGGTRQYVVLGAGLDTFAHRNPHAGLRVFEVDHPATQGWKQSLLAAGGIISPPSLTFVPVDFESDSLRERLAASGFDVAAPAFFSWLGVVPYLTREGFRQTAAFAGSLRGAQLVFDYATDPADLGAAERAAFEMLAKRVRAAGEPFRLMLRPAAMHEEMRAAGFARAQTLTSAQINERYFAGRADGLKILGTIGHFMHAGV